MKAQCCTMAGSSSASYQRVAPNSGTSLLPQPGNQAGHGDAGNEGLPERISCRMPGDPAPMWPPSSVVFEMFFFRRLFADMIKGGHFGKDGKVHVTVVRNISIRLMDTMDLNGVSNVNDGFFGRKANMDKTWFTWKDICLEMMKEGCPDIPLNLGERVLLTMERADSSILATIYSFFMLFVILGNLLLMIIQSLSFEQCNRMVPEFLDDPTIEDPSQACGGRFQTGCILIFSAEYFTKLICSPFVHRARFDMDIALRRAIPAFEPKSFADMQPQTRINRIVSFLVMPSNIIDLISVLPWWIGQIAGHLLPPGATSSLRILRVTRIFRIFKTGRYLETLQVLGAALAASLNAVVVLVIFMGIVSLVFGFLLASTGMPKFSSIPFNTYWSFAEVVMMKHAPGVTEAVDQMSGLILLSVLMTVKAFLWILPIGKIKAAFDDADLAHRSIATMRSTMVYELTRPDWTSWYGLSKSVRCRLDIFCEDPADSTGRLLVVTSGMPMPVLEAKTVKDELEITLPSMNRRGVTGNSEGASLSIDFEWQPSAEMKEVTAPALPDGTLRLNVGQGHGFPGSDSAQWWVEIRVPTGLCGEAVTQHTFASLPDQGGNEPNFMSAPVAFVVRWTQSLEAASPNVFVKPPPAGHASPVNPSPHFFAGENDEEEHKAAEEFRQKTIEFLEDQSVQLAEQSKRIVVLERLLKEQGLGL